MLAGGQPDLRRPSDQTAQAEAGRQTQVRARGRRERTAEPPARGPRPPGRERGQTPPSGKWASHHRERVGQRPEGVARDDRDGPSPGVDVGAGVRNLCHPQPSAAPREPQR